MKLRLGFVIAILFAASAIPAAAAPTVLDKSIERAGTKVLQVEAGGVAISFEPGDVAAIRVRVNQDPSAPAPEVDSAKSGNRLAVTVKPPGQPPLIPFVPSHAPAYTITYPADMRLDARISSGDITVTKPVASVELYDQNGNINVDAPRAAITAENGIGNINVTRALAPIDLEADDGDVNATLASGWYGNEVRIQTASGAIHLSVPPGFRAKIDASSENGTVHNALSSSGNSPFVWLYALRGDVFLDQRTDQ